MKKMLLIAAVAIVLVATAVVVAHAYGQICYGRVLSDIQEPLPMATINILYADGTPTGINSGSGKSGLFPISGCLPAGNYICRVSKEGWMTRNKSFYYNGTTAVNLGNIVLFQ